MPTKKFDDYLTTRETERDEAAAAVYAAASAHFAGIQAELGIGHQLANLREDAGLTQAQLADRAGISQGDISRIERDAANPTAKNLTRLGSALGLELTWRKAHTSH